ncbi:hypothetical protein L228DRAFT_126548 [Xylona heveae TC161]|uniref:Zn(2)-C6 fungal-type domain-containing protein n=1 Tax=Xylona heveae (strain CBS 132557 / TC161) TaxID=1328760 RepID=A0A165HT87_XYLHT|nr:hypothetical protein L228DRAFT_126548 [Xylona heveae TC161]KZF23903.1 hypothetical protein L228DRAFT_126548 [Xylona heveae TC161]
MHRNHGRACDACASRKIRCNREVPCQRCKELSIPCRVARPAAKPGPKGPWALKRRPSPQNLRRKDHVSKPTYNQRSSTTFPDARIPQSILLSLLAAYNEKLYPLWPVIDTDEIARRLNDFNDWETYALAVALCAVTIVQLNIKPPHDGHERYDGLSLAVESERTRAKYMDQEQPSIPVLLTSFFLHIFSANHGQVCKATLLLREAITFAQFLGLEEYEQPSKEAAISDTQLQRRILWLLFITERGHTTRFGLSRLLQKSPPPPQLGPGPKAARLVSFVSLCRLFHTFGHAMDTLPYTKTSDFFVQYDTALQAIPQIQSADGIVKADFLVTQQWMRIVLWKSVMFNFPLNSALKSNDAMHLAFPECVARNVVSYLNNFPREILEAHGLGMEMKLTEVAISLADVLICGPTSVLHAHLMRIGPGEVLSNLGQFLKSFRGGGNPRLELLQEKMFTYAESRSLSLSPPLSQFMPNLDNIEGIWFDTGQEENDSASVSAPLDDFPLLLQF